MAALFGHEAALFCPSGSMANQIALQLLVPRGGELLAGADAHVVTYELGAAAAIGGISTRTWPSVGAALDPDADRRDDPAGRLPVRADPGDRRRADPQPGRRRGRPAWTTLRALRAVADRRRSALHCDGARIWHAHVADGVPLADVRRAVRHAVGLPVQGPRRAGRLAGRRQRRADRRGPGDPQADGRRHAPGRHPGRGRRGTPWTTTSTGSPTTTRAPGGWPPPWTARAWSTPPTVRTNLVPARPDQGAAGRAGAGRGRRRAGRADRGDAAAARPPGHPPGRRRRRHRPGDRGAAPLCWPSRTFGYDL